jgi:hypothetical protein
MKEFVMQEIYSKDAYLDKNAYLAKITELARNGDRSTLRDLIRSRFKYDRTPCHGIISPNIGDDYHFFQIFIEDLSIYDGFIDVFAGAFMEALFEDIQALDPDTPVGTEHGYLMNSMLFVFNKTFKFCLNEMDKKTAYQFACRELEAVSDSKIFIFNSSMRAVVAVSLLCNGDLNSSAMDECFDLFLENLKAGLQQPEYANPEIMKECAAYVARCNPVVFVQDFFWKLCAVGLYNPQINGWLRALCWEIGRKNGTAWKTTLFEHIYNSAQENPEYFTKYSKYLELILTK